MQISNYRQIFIIGCSLAEVAVVPLADDSIAYYSRGANPTTLFLLQFLIDPPTFFRCHDIHAHIYIYILLRTSRWAWRPNRRLLQMLPTINFETRVWFPFSRPLFLNQYSGRSWVEWFDRLFMSSETGKEVWGIAYDLIHLIVVTCVCYDFKLNL